MIKTFKERRGDKWIICDNTYSVYKPKPVEGVLQRPSDVKY